MDIMTYETDYSISNIVYTRWRDALTTSDFARCVTERRLTTQRLGWKTHIAIYDLTDAYFTDWDVVAAKHILCDAPMPLEYLIVTPSASVRMMLTLLRTLAPNFHFEVFATEGAARARAEVLLRQRGLSNPSLA